jgi:hypothetical protein
MKKYFAIASALAITMGVFAFSPGPKKAPEQKKATTTLMWFDFSGTSESDYENLDLYAQDPNHKDPCTGSGLRCEVYAPVIASGPDAGKPDLSQIQAETFKP